MYHSSFKYPCGAPSTLWKTPTGINLIILIFMISIIKKFFFGFKRFFLEKYDFETLVSTDLTLI